MDVSTIIRHRLKELGLDQQHLAAATRVTESYISQLLTRKKMPPASDRTDIYDKMGRFLKLPPGQLGKWADLQRREELKKKLLDPPGPLYQEVRELILRKCKPEKTLQLREIFEKEPFGAIERLVTQKLLDVVKKIVREELDSENWLRIVARLNGRSYEQTRVTVLEFLDTDIFNLSAENCTSFLEPLIEAWEMDLATFGIEIVLNRRLAPVSPKRFELVESETDQPAVEPGLEEFLRDPVLSAGIKEDEVAFLKALRFKARRPTALYFYRELQNLRDPVHFSTATTVGAKTDGSDGRGTAGGRLPRMAREGSIAPLQKHREAEGIEKQLKLETRKAAVRRWKKHARRVRPTTRKKGSGGSAAAGSNLTRRD